MCGIVGIWDYNQADTCKDEMDRFTDSLAHRGPDGRGTYYDSQAHLQLGHRRLSILDLSLSAQQPMSYSDGRYWIVLNGEIFNFLELKLELLSKRYIFRTNSDTEVVLAAYIEWGKNCQLKFNGMWAFAIWDSIDRVLFISRDRFGIKPLHYIFTDRFFAFASEMKAFLALNCYDYSFDQDIMEEVLTNINSIEGTEYSLLKGVKHLLGGNCMIMHENRPPIVYQWWHTLDHLSTVSQSFEKQVEQFREIFFDACRIRMRSDVPLGTSLSGGLDSSAVLGTIHSLGQSKQFTNDWQKAFVACFPGTYLDEQKYAFEMIKAKNATPIYTNIRVNDWLSQIENIVYQQEDIYFVLLAGIWQNYKTMRENGVVVSLDGHGSDELLGGYHFIVEEEKRKALCSPFKIKRYFDLKTTFKGFEGGSNPINSSLKNDLILAIKFAMHGSIGQSIQPINRFFRRRTPYSFYADKKLASFQLNRQNQIKRSQEMIGFSNLNRNLYTYFHHTILPTILRNFDRLSMSNGVEVRMPFMDWRLVCFAFSLPDKSKIGGGYTKRILREAMLKTLPESVRLRTNKIGFTSPMVKWLKEGLANLFVTTVNENGFLSSSIWDGHKIKNTIDECLIKKDWVSIERFWRYINAQLLIQTFDKQRRLLK